MNDRRLHTIFDALQSGLAWDEVAKRYGYVDAQSAAGSFRMMLRKRGLMLQRKVTVDLSLVPDPRAEWRREREARRAAIKAEFP